MSKLNKFTKEVLEEIVKKCDTYAEVCTLAGLDPNVDNNRDAISRKIKRLNISVKHFSNINIRKMTNDRFNKEKLIELINK